MLYSAAIDIGVEVRLASRIVHIDESIPTVSLANGEKIEGDLLVGADGMLPQI
jgi:2-polyprenyl-6-methoxyphenol hydroxylase-like FAD-dependent oxidoreductase